MSDLETRLRTLCKNGSLLTIGLDRTTSGEWRAAYRNTDNHRVNIETSKDPIDAICKVLTPLRTPSVKQLAHRQNDDLI